MNIVDEGPVSRATAEQSAADQTGQRCLNCGEPIQGKYCAECGQKAGPRLLTMGQLTEDLLNGLFSYDSKFVRTARLLLTRPGVLTREYIDGRRAGYLAPFQLFLWVNAIFFLVYSFVFATAARDNATPLYRALLCTTLIMAFFLALVYWRQRRLLIEHLVFSLHVNTFVTIVFLLFCLVCLAALRAWPRIGNVRIDPFLMPTLTIAFLVYSWFAARVVYRERAFKTAVKVAIVTLLSIGAELVFVNAFRRL